jgi:hypothetical protein
VSKPFAPRHFLPAGWTVAIVALAAIAVVCIGRLRTHPPSEAARPDSAPSQTPAPGAEGTEHRGRIRPSLGEFPLVFEANQGQTDPRAKYIVRASGYALFLTANDLVFALRSSSQPAAQTTRKCNWARAAHVTSQASKECRTAAIHMRLLGGSPGAQIVASNQVPSRTNYFIGNDPGKWQANVPQYARVSYRNVYPGVSIAFYGVQRQLEFDFIVAPGASTAPIRLGVSGADRITMDDAGNLRLASQAGDVLLHKPIAYQEKDGARHPVEVSFVLDANNQVSFQVEDDDRSRELVIDPSVSYATYLGGTLEDDGNAIAIDSSGNTYITGQTTSTDFPTVPGSYRTTNAGALDVFVTKISADGSTLIYSTYIGGSGDDSGNAIAVDASGDAFVAGVTASATDFPATSGALQTAFGGGGLDAFVFELNSGGTALTFSTYLGGSGDDVANGLALDGSGNTYVVGSTTSTNFPTQNPVQAAGDGTSSGFVAKLNSSGSGLVFSTYLGGSGNDFAAAVALDSSNNVYVTGATQNPSFPVTANAFQKTCGSDGTCNGGLADAFVTVFKANGSGFVYSTFLGGESVDQGYGIAVDSAGDAYVTGATLSSDFPLKSPIQDTNGGAQDAFVAALTPAGSALLYSTYLGGSLNDTGTGIAVDAGNNVYVTGQTGSADFPTANPTQPSLGGDNDAFVTEINAGGSRFLFSTYLGGSLNENAETSIANENTIAIGAIAVDQVGANIYVTGNTFSTDFPTHSAYQPNNAGPGYADSFIAKYAQANFAVATSALSPPAVNPGISATSTITVGALNGFSTSVSLTCAVSPTTANSPTCGLSPASVNPGTPSTLTVTTKASTTPANYEITVTGTSGGFVHTASANISVQDFSIAASPLSPATVNPGGSATSTITVNAINGFGASVALTCAVSPASANSPTCGLNLGSVTPGTALTLTVASSATTPGDIYTVTVTGTYGADVHMTTVKLTVDGFLISATTPAAVNPGTSGTSTVTLTALNGYNLPVSLTCSVTGPGSPLPACSAASFSVNPVTPTGLGAQTTLTITTALPAKTTIRHESLLSPMWFPAMGISLLGFSCIAACGRRRKLVAVTLLGLLLAPLLMLPSCGGSNSPGTCTAVPNAPTALATSSTTSTGTILTWNAPAAIGAGNCGSVTYTIYQNGTKIGTSSTTGFNVLGLSPSTTYMFAVAASDNAGMGPPSAPLSVATSSGATPAGSYAITISGTDANNLSNSTQVTLTVNEN